MAKIGDYMWESEQPGIEPDSIVHRIVEVQNGLTPTDSECEEYKVACGRFGQSWAMPSQGIRLFCAGDEYPEWRQLCRGCFPETF